MVEEDHPHRFRAYSGPTGMYAGSRADWSCEVLIAAIALEHGVTLFTLDKDFSKLAGITRLPLYLF